MISIKQKKKQEQFKKEMEEIRKDLPPNWIQIILSKKKLSAKRYKKLYNTLVNLRACRSYRSSLKHKALIREMTELSDKYKNLEL